MKRGPLIIVSGPSGSGKSTLIREVLRRHPDQLRLAISATTRPRREGEEDRRDYYFWTPEEFERGLKEGLFLEHARVHGVYLYGTLRSEVDSYREQGWGVILDIDVEGAAQVRPLYPDHLSVFIALPNEDTYRQRLQGRRSESPEWVERRMRTAQEELKHAGEYKYTIVNDHLPRAVDELDRLVMKDFEGEDHA
jgi:guanylate kinase